MNRDWRKFSAGLIAPFVAIWLVFIAVRDGFVLQSVAFRSKGHLTTFAGKDAVLLGVAMLAGAVLCLFVAYQFWFRD